MSTPEPSSLGMFVLMLVVSLASSMKLFAPRSALGAVLFGAIFGLLGPWLFMQVLPQVLPQASGSFRSELNSMILAGSPFVVLTTPLAWVLAGVAVWSAIEGLHSFFAGGSIAGFFGVSSADDEPGPTRSHARSKAGGSYTATRRKP